MRKHKLYMGGTGFIPFLTGNSDCMSSSVYRKLLNRSLSTLDLQIFPKFQGVVTQHRLVTLVLAQICLCIFDKIIYTFDYHNSGANPKVIASVYHM